MSFTGILSIALGAILVENFILVQFLGICPFMGVSKKMDTATGMGLAVIFVMAGLHVLLDCERVFAGLPGSGIHADPGLHTGNRLLVQFVEMFLQKFIPRCTPRWAYTCPL